MAVSTEKTKESEYLKSYLSRLSAGDTWGHQYVLLLGLQTFDAVDLMRKVQTGLPFRAFERFMGSLDLPKSLVCTFTQIPARTLSRRKQEGKLLPEESDRLLRASRIFALALQLFEGDVAATRAWLVSPQAALGGTSPLEFASTDLGAREVESLIGRLEYGIPS